MKKINLAEYIYSKALLRIMKSATKFNVERVDAYKWEQYTDNQKFDVSFSGHSWRKDGRFLTIVIDNRGKAECTFYDELPPGKEENRFETLVSFSIDKAERTPQDRPKDVLVVLNRFFWGSSQPKDVEIKSVFVRDEKLGANE